MNMPSRYGIEVARRLLAVRPETPVILASGYLQPREIEEAEALGIREVVLKPTSIEQMAGVTARLLPARRP